jgi:hypothetical protein
VKIPFDIELAKAGEPVYFGDSKRQFMYIGLSDPRQHQKYVVVENYIGNLLRFAPEELYHEKKVVKYANLYLREGVYRFGDLSDSQDIADKWSKDTTGFIKTITIEI